MGPINEALAQALGDEFPWMNSDEAGWTRATDGVIAKLRAQGYAIMAVTHQAAAREPIQARCEALEGLASAVLSSIDGAPDHPWIPGGGIRPVMVALAELGDAVPTRSNFIPMNGIPRKPAVVSNEDHEMGADDD